MTAGYAGRGVISLAKTGAEVRRVSSLLAHLFSLEGASDRAYDEALFTTFNVDLGFFEARALGMARAAGAAVTVLADASIYSPDARSLKGAGASYHVGLAATKAAFHPKVTVLVGPEHVLAAVGSGNLTTGGWLSNDETLTVALGSARNGVPAIVTDIADWLRSLETVRIGALARAAINRTARALDRITAAATLIDTGHRLVTTSNGPIIDQLPTETVDEFHLHAPFHDPQGAALDALLDRFRPERLRIAVQPGRTIIDPTRLAEVAQTHRVDLTWQDAGVGYRHGKVIEAIVGAGGWSLTGSPNLTGAALLRSLAEGGNCEVGVILPGKPDLYPADSVPINLADIPRRQIINAPGEAPAADHAAPRLIGATLAEGGVHVELSAAATAGLSVEMSRYDDLPEHFVSIGVLPIGERQATLSAPGAAARARIRLQWLAEGAPAWGPFLPLSDPHAVVRRLRPARNGARNTDAEWADLFGSEALRDDWTRQLDKVFREQRAAPLPRPASGPRSESADVHATHGWRTVDDAEAWAQYAEDAIARLGPSLAREASGGVILPHLPSPGADASVSEPIWADDFDQDVAEFDDERSAEDQDDAVVAEGNPARTQPTAAERTHVRRWLERLTNGLSERPAIDRIALVRLILTGTYFDVWDEKQQWFDILARGAESLPSDDIPPQIGPEVASLAALCLYRLDQGADHDRRVGSGRRYVQLAAQLVTLANRAEAARVSAIMKAMHGDTVFAVKADVVLDHLARAAQTNPWPEVARLVQLEHSDWLVELERDAVIYIEGAFTNAFYASSQVFAFAPDDVTMAVRAQPKRRDETILVRHQGTLTVQTQRGGRTIWKTYRLDGLLSPGAIATSDETERRARIDPPPWFSPSATATAALAAAGLT